MPQYGDTDVMCCYMSHGYSIYHGTDYKFSLSLSERVSVCLLARLQTWRAIIFSRVCLSVCLWPALLPFNVDRFWWNLVTRTILWTSLAATIMVHIGRRGTARRLLKISKKFSKTTKFEFQNSGPSFLRLYLLCIVKKFDSIPTKLTEEIHFEVCHSGNVPPIVSCIGSTGGVAACSDSRRQRCADPEMLRPHHSSDSDHRSANWRHSELGAQSGRKNQPACISYCDSSAVKANFAVNLY